MINIDIVHVINGVPAEISFSFNRYERLCISPGSDLLVSVVEYHGRGPDLLLLLLHQRVQALVTVQVVEGDPGVQPLQVELELAPEQHLHLPNLENLQQLYLYLYNCLLWRFVFEVVILINYNYLATFLITYVLAVCCLVTSSNNNYSYSSYQSIIIQ